ncbi:C39 family peptidase [Actinomadura graeca]|uniref:C39 family peptidase n=1 Tax=Actinomadura graeca TaxID=2750812 RepID=A0ABX8QS06_9ACTN|nr:papain-like cysteine protease family protein [Actinomadura graeca]QXJ21599.1 C39 family peptidase [Actinomadura graeca]
MATRTRPARARWRIACGVAGLAAATVAASPGIASADNLKINQEVQEQNQWCWAASGLTIAKFHGKGNVSQNEFCNLARNRTAGTQCPNQPGQLEWDQTAFRKLGLSVGQVSNPLSYNAVKEEIDGKRPIETGIYWTAGGGHAQVIYGYTGQTLAYGDPWPASPRYSEMSHSSYTNNSQFRWGQALYKVGA